MRVISYDDNHPFETTADDSIRENKIKVGITYFSRDRTRAVISLVYRTVRSLVVRSNIISLYKNEVSDKNPLAISDIIRAGLPFGLMETRIK